MELWIRSQDKTNLMLAKDIVVSDGNIKVYKDTELCTTVAMYKTKERALEVLDEIQKILMPMIHYEPIIRKKANYSLSYVQTEQIGSKVEIQELSTYVYEMPKE